MEHIFLDEQITIPEEFPTILKDYAKAAIKTNPTDLLEWSLKYFTALKQGQKPPVRKRLKFEKREDPFMTTTKEDMATVEATPRHATSEKVVHSILEHFSSLDFNINPVFPKLTKIVCTIGPSSEDVDTLVQLMEAGMSVARMNFSHGTHEYHGNVAQNVRDAAKIMAEKNNLPSYPVAIALDTKGPEIRTGLLDGGPSEKYELKEGSMVTLTTDESYREKCSDKIIYVDYKNITKVVKEGDKVFMDDGFITLVVKKVEPDSLECEIENGNILGEQKGCNLPGVETDLPSTSEKDKEDLLFGVEQGVDMIFASFIRNAAAVHEIREILGDEGKHIQIIPKIENHEGVENIDEIIEASDGIMVARGDLGILIPTEKIFLVEKIVMAKCNIAGKPVICATQMLDSMIKKPRPTRAESTDVANAVFDGADAVMLSGESAKGKYPILCVKTMHAICREAEAVLYHKTIFSDLVLKETIPTDPVTSIAIAVVSASMKCLASAIIVLTRTGVSAYRIAKFRPACPIIAVSRQNLTTRQCQVSRGIIPVHFDGERLPDWKDDVDTRIQYGIEIGKESFLKSGDTVIVVTGWEEVAGTTNSMSIITVQ